VFLVACATALSWDAAPDFAATGRDAVCVASEGRTIAAAGLVAARAAKSAAPVATGEGTARVGGWGISSAAG